MVLADDRGDLLPQLLPSDVDGAKAVLGTPFSATGHGGEELADEVLFRRGGVDGSEPDGNSVFPLPDAKLDARRELARLCVETRRGRSSEGVIGLLTKHLRATPPRAAVAAADLGRGRQRRDVGVVQALCGTVFTVVAVFLFGFACVEVVLVLLGCPSHRRHVHGVGKGVEKPTSTTSHPVSSLRRTFYSRLAERRADHI